MSELMYDIIPAVPCGGIRGLQRIILKLEDHLMNTNENLGKFRQLIRKESNINTRNIYLSKVYAMVKEQYTIQSILENYKRKLNDLGIGSKQQSHITAQSGQHYKNDKLIELFNNCESMETRVEKRPVKIYEPSSDNVKKRKADDEQNNVEVVTSYRISIDNHGKALKCLKAKKKQKQVHAEDQRQDEQKHENPPELLEEDKKPEISTVATTDQKEYILKVEEQQHVGAEDEREDAQNHIKVPDSIKVEQEHEAFTGAIPEQIAVNNHSEAMQCLKALQEYAMLNENFRAIGLLMETEKAFINPPDETEFEL